MIVHLVKPDTTVVGSLTMAPGELPATGDSVFTAMGGAVYTVRARWFTVVGGVVHVYLVTIPERSSTVGVL